MITVYKYKLDIQKRTTIRAPRGMKPLHVGYQNEGPRYYMFVWALVDTEKPEIDHTFYVLGTGHDAEIPNHMGAYVGTAQEPEYPLVWHVFKEED